MKKKLVFLMILLIIINNAFAQSMGFDIVGVYLPVKYIETLQRTKHNPTSWAAFSGDDVYHTVYIVDTHKIKTSGKYDGENYVSLWDIFDFQFENINDEIYLIDNNRKEFKKIPGELYEYEYWDEIIGNFIGNIILDELINNNDVILENNIITFPVLDNKKFIIKWQAYDPRERRNLYFEGITDYDTLSLEIRQNEYVFYGYHRFSTDIVWSNSYDNINIFPIETDFYGVWVNDLDVKHIISANEWTFLSPNGNNYTMSNLIWTKATNYDTLASDYLYGFSITGTIVSIRYNNPHYLFIGTERTVSYFIHKTDKTKIVAGNNPIEVYSFYIKTSE